MVIIKQEAKIKSSPATVYDILTNAERFSEMTAAAAEIDPVDGGEFSLFDGQIVGRNVELIPGERIIQAWRATTWKPGVFSIVAFRFKTVADATLIRFEQIGFPDEAQEDLEIGWKKMYWEPLKKVV